MPNNSTLIAPEHAKEFCKNCFLTVPLSPADADLISESLVESDLKGVYSHGIQLLPRYIRGLKNGINPNPEIKTIVDAGSLSILDGDCGMGQVVGAKGMQLAIERAKLHGIASVAIRNSNHLGALAYYGMMAIKHDMIGMSSTNAASIMAPWGGVTETLGNNPICYAIPSGNSYPIMLDMAISTAARNKIRVAAAKGESIPLGWGLDREGRPTEDPEKALNGLVAPMAEAKGFGLGIVMEIMTAVLAGGTLSKDLPRDAIRSTSIFYPTYVSHYFHAIDIQRIMPIKEFKSKVDQLTTQVHESALAKGSGGVFMPGEIEFITKKERLKNGIPTPQSTLETLDQIAQEVGVAPLST